MHEIGHFLGLDHPGSGEVKYQQYIMSQMRYPRNPYLVGPHSEEILAVRYFFLY